MSSKCLRGCLLLLMLPVHAHAREVTQAMLQQLYQQASPALGLVRYSSEIVNANTGEVSRRDGTGLGVVVSPGGLVMTQGHMVLEGNSPFNITLTLDLPNMGPEYPCLLLDKPSDINVVFLQIQSDEPLQLPYVKFRPGAPLGIGQPLTLLGVLGDSLDHVPALENVRITAMLEQPRRTYCLDAAIRFGFVGAPVFNTEGEAVGVVGFDLSRGEGAEVYARSGHPLLYQADLFHQYIERPPGERAEDGANEAWLGVFTQPLTDRFAEYWKLEKNGGLIVSTVVPNSPAAAVGLRPGDIITSFNQIPVRARHDRDVNSFTQLVRQAGAGNEVEITLLRAGQPEHLRVLVGQRPRTSRNADEYEDPILGLTVREITTDMRIAMNLPEQLEGVLVRRVRSGSPAQEAGIRAMLVVLRVGDHSVGSLEEYRAAVTQLMEAQPKEISLFGQAGATTGFFRLIPRW